jgi:glycosyltransferase involved in cell wall biosynthesis
LAGTTQFGASAALAARDWKVTIVAPDDGDAERLVKAAGHSFIGVSRSTKPGMGWLTFGRSLKRELPKVLATGQFDVALIEWQAVAGSHKSIRESGVPWLVVDRSPPVYRSLAGRLQWFEYRRAWRLAKRSNGSVLKSQSLGAFLYAKGLRVKPVTTMEAGVDIAKFSPTNFSGPPTIVHHGRLDKEREIERLVRIGEILSARGVEFRMRIAGTGNRLEALQKATLMHDWLEVLGPIPHDEIPEFLACGHCALFPLPYGELWNLASPLKLREWAAAGLPMVVSDIEPHKSPGFHHWIRLVRRGATNDQWADVVEELLGDDLAALGAEAREFAEKNFDWAHVTEDLHERISELAGI